MKLRTRLFFLSVLLSVAVTSCVSESEETPTVTASPARVPAALGHVDVRGSGFTPNQNVTSHLRGPDGVEFPVLPILTDARGEFTHRIETLVLLIGPHELWVVDEEGNSTSNVARFEVTRDAPPVP